MLVFIFLGLVSVLSAEAFPSVQEYRSVLRSPDSQTSKNKQDILTVSEEHDESTRGDEEARCGTPDNDEGERYLSNRKWDKTNLKYHIWYSRDIHLPYKTQEEVMKRAFAQWSKASPKLNFTQTYCLEEADIKISFLEKITHAGPGEKTCKIAHVVPVMTREIGHAFGPGDGRIHFNEMEDWNYQSSFIYTDVYSVALHFTGHVLGLRHSNAKGSVMGSVYSRRHKELSQDDIMAIRSLYGQ